MEEYLLHVPGWNNHDTATEERFEFLFSSFPTDRTPLNRYGYDDKLRFWKKIIVEISKLGLLAEGDLLQIKQSTAISKLSRGRLYPGCISTVLKSLEDENVLESVKTWNKRLEERGIVTLVKNAAHIILETSGKVIRRVKTTLFPFLDEEGGDSQGVCPDDAFILSGYCKDLCFKAIKNISDNINTYTQRLITVEDFVKEFTSCYEEERRKLHKIIFKTDRVMEDAQMHCTLSSDDIRLGLFHAKEARYLNLPVEIHHIFKLSREDLLNLPAKVIFDLPDLLSKITATITHADLEIINVKKKQRTLTDSLEHLDSRVNLLRTRAKDHLKAGERKSASLLLREAKPLSNAVHTIRSSLENVKAILISVDSLETYSSILEAYKSGTRGIEKLKKQFDLSIESVQDSIDAFNASLEDNRAIEIALHSAVSDFSYDNYYYGDANDDEIEKELDALAKSGEVDDSGPLDVDNSKCDVKDLSDRVKALNLERGGDEDSTQRSLHIAMVD